MWGKNGVAPKGLHSQSPSIHAKNKPHTQMQQIQCNIENE
jgi:hypothetical protein